METCVIGFPEFDREGGKERKGYVSQILFFFQWEMKYASLFPHPPPSFLSVSPNLASHWLLSCCLLIIPLEPSAPFGPLFACSLDYRYPPWITFLGRPSPH